MNSLNGTYLNNQKLATGSSSELKENDKISFGKEGSIYTFNYSFSNLQNHEVKHIKDPNIFVSETYKADESNSTAEFRKKEESVEDEEDVIIQKKELKFLQETLFFKEEQIQNKDKQIEFLSNEENSLKEELEKVK